MTKERKFMLRYYFLIIRNLFRIPIFSRKMRKLAQDVHTTEEERYELMQEIIDLMQKTSYVKTEVYGEENLPQEGGYVMYPNHQGKYDAYGIASVHEKPCTVVMDKDKSYAIFVNDVIELLQGKRLDKQDVKQAFGVILDVAKEVAQGRKYILFPEGEYENKNPNDLGPFKSGCFKISLKSKTPIVPVTIVDSYKAWNTSKFGTVTTQVHFLPPILFDEFKEMKTPEIADMVKTRIQEKLSEILNNNC